MKFNGHDKRVTLNLARLSKCAKEIVGLPEALDAVALADYDIYAIEQRHQEAIYVHFTEELESNVKAEFEVDPTTLIDHWPKDTTCALCGQKHIRFEFKINNIAGGEGVNCGSACIITHAMHVKGAETADLARKALECAIRKQLRKILIEQWHKITGFTIDQLVETRAALVKVSQTWELPHTKRSQAKRYAYDLKLMERFYNRNGWIGTRQKWATWTEAIKLVRSVVHEGVFSIPVPQAYEVTMGKLPPVADTDGAPQKTMVLEGATVTKAQLDEAKEDAPQIELKVALQKAIAKDNAEKDLAAHIGDPTFSGITNTLVFGDKQ